MKSLSIWVLMALGLLVAIQRFNGFDVTATESRHRSAKGRTALSDEDAPRGRAEAGQERGLDKIVAA